MIISDVMPWRRRRTARWMSLSLAARGAVEGIVAAMNERGELQLPRDGLASLAAVLGRPWLEVEPAVLEALASGKLAYDPERLLMTDPTRTERAVEDRQELAELAVPRLEVTVADGDFRRLSSTPAARRARAWRLAKKLREAEAAAELGARQLGLFVPPVRANVRAPLANATEVEPTALPTRNPEASLERSVASTTERDGAPSLSLISSSSTKKKRGAAATIPLDKSTPLPLGWLELAREARPDLTEDYVQKLWKKFAGWPHVKKPTWKSWGAVQSVWDGWLDRERIPYAPAPQAGNGAPGGPTGPRASSNATDAPYYRPARHAAPDCEPEAPRTLRPILGTKLPEPERVRRLAGADALMNAVRAIGAAS